MNDLYIGLMSGTSVDGIDAVLIDFNGPFPEVLATHYNKFTPKFKEAIVDLCQSGMHEINRMAELDNLLAKQFAKSVKTLLKQQALTPKHIQAIGCHGQTIRHYPHQSFTLQIGDPNIIAAETGITTIADFRRRDLALGGQGAPLVPAFHAAIFKNHAINRAIVNIGGIANVTILAASSNLPIKGFDIGPGNTLLDAWVYKHLKQDFDAEGNWARSGTIDQNLLARLLADPFFKLLPPKSTGREYFNLNWLEKQLLPSIKPQDVQATLTELTAISIVTAVREHFHKGEIYVCGGGAQNTALMQNLRRLAGQHYLIESTEKVGIHPHWVEAAAFAWLAKQTLSRLPGNIPEVTGAKAATILGGIYFA